MSKWKNVVEADWLYSKLFSGGGTLRKSSGVQVVDCSWHMPASNRNGYKEFQRKHIPGARFFDLDECSDHSTDLPHMMPTANQFRSYMEGIGVNSKEPIVLYDSLGLFSAARVWFMIKAFGKVDVAVLDGGLISWERSNYPLESMQEKADNNGLNDEKVMYEIKGDPAKYIFSRHEVLDNVETSKDKKTEMVDARSNERFTGKVEEPRKGLKRGHIPTAKNVPFTALLDPNTKKFLPVKELKNVFDNAGVNSKEGVIFSCGSGVTACVPMLGLVEYFNLDFERIKLYDGSFSEWGKPELSLPIETISPVSL